MMRSLTSISANSPAATARIVFVVTIYEADARKQTFGQVNHAYIRVLDAEGGDREIARHDLSEDASTETAMLLANSIVATKSGHSRPSARVMPVV